MLSSIDAWGPWHILYVAMHILHQDVRSLAEITCCPPSRCQILDNKYNLLSWGIYYIAMRIPHWFMMLSANYVRQTQHSWSSVSTLHNQKLMTAFCQINCAMYTKLHICPIHMTETSLIWHRLNCLVAIISHFGCRSILQLFVLINIVIFMCQ